MPGESILDASAPSPETTLVVVLGASEWPRWAGQTGGTQFHNSAVALRDYFRDERGFNLPPDNLLWLFDEDEGPDDLDGRLAGFLKARADVRTNSARDLLVYYVGHGGFERGSSDYYLTLRNSRPDGLSVSCLRMESLARRVKESARHLRCYLILDCCFAGRGVESLMSPVSDVTAALTKTAFEKYPNKGTALFCSSAKDKAAQAPPDKTYTMFTGALLRALREGSAHEPERISLLSLGDLTWGLIEEEFKDESVRPEVHPAYMPQGDISRLPLFPNLSSQKSPARPAERPVLFEPVEGETQAYVVLSEAEGRGLAAEALPSVVGKALYKYQSSIEGVTKMPLRCEPHVVNALEVFASREQYENALLALCRAEIVAFDLTNYEPAVMLLLGIRSVVRRGVTISSAGGGYRIGEALDFPFNIKEVNIVSHSVEQLKDREPIDIVGDRIIEGFRQLSTLPNYLDLPTFDAVRNLPPDPASRLTHDYREQVLLLCSFSEKYQSNNWRAHIRRNLPVYLPRDKEKNRDSEILRTLDMKSPRLVSQSLYEAIRQVEMCVADWTEWRPNVFFELGVRLATNSIGPVCIIEDSHKALLEQLSKGAPVKKKRRRAPDAAEKAEEAAAARLAGAARQCLLLLDSFAPIVYRCTPGDMKGDVDAYKRMVERHVRNRDAQGLAEWQPEPESAAEIAPNFTYRAIEKFIDWRVEVAAKPVYRELLDAANMISAPEVDSAGKSPLLYPDNDELKAKTESGALERRLAAWYYMHNRYQQEEILADPDLTRDYELLGDRLISSLLLSSVESYQVLGDKIDELMGDFKKLREKAERKLDE